MKLGFELSVQVLKHCVILSPEIKNQEEREEEEEEEVTERWRSRRGVLTVLDVGVVTRHAVQADVLLVASGYLRVSHAGRQGDNEGLHKLDGVGTDTIIVRVQQHNDVPSHGGHHVPAGFLELADDP